MAEEAIVVNNESAVTDAPQTDSTPVETPKSEEKAYDAEAPFELDKADFKDGAADGDEGLDTPDDDSDDSAASDDTDEVVADETSKDEPTDKPSVADERKANLNTEIRDLVSQRNQIREQIKQETGKYYEARTPDQLVGEVNPDTGEYFSPLEARMQAQEEALALRDMNDQRAESQLVIETESERVLRDMPMFRPFKAGTESFDPATGQMTGEANAEYQPGIAQNAAELVKQNFIRDPNTEQVDQRGNRIPGTGQIVGQHMSTYQLYKLINDAAQLGATTGEIKGQKNANKMAARADTPSSAGPKEKKGDKFLEAFDREFA